MYWTLGQEASCNINATVGIMIYDGEYTVNVKVQTVRTRTSYQRWYVYVPQCH